MLRMLLSLFIGNTLPLIEDIDFQTHFIVPGLASRCWENLVLAMLGEQFMVGEEICGAVVSVRYQVNQ